LWLLARCREDLAHHLGVGVVVAQDPLPIAEHLLMQRYSAGQVTC
jgi:hypothetical protein